LNTKKRSWPSDILLIEPGCYTEEHIGPPTDEIAVLVACVSNRSPIISFYVDLNGGACGAYVLPFFFDVVF